MKDTRFMTAAEKEVVLKHWLRFVKNGFKHNDFTEKLYKHLTPMPFGNIFYDFLISYSNSPLS